MPQRGMLGTAVALALSTVVVEASSQSIQSTTLPAGARVVGGQATVTQSGAAMSIQQSSARAALDWQSFNIGSQASVTFNQPSSSAIALNRVLGAGASEIYGHLSANGQVFLINPNGVLFGRGAEVNVGGLVASTLDMSAADFMSGRYVLRGNGAAGTIVNQGAIRTSARGSVALVAPRVQNAGTIEAPQGAVSLVAANAATVEYLADGLVQIRVDQGALQAELDNSGVLRADGGSVTLSAKALDSLARSVINNSGIIEARSVENANGVVRLAGDDVTLQSSSIVSAAGGGQVEIYGSQVLADGLIDASSTARGGSIKLLGDNVGVVGTARIDASGDLGGGQILVGGNFRGTGPEPNATAVYVGRDVQLDASARTSGDGGRVVVWSDQATRFYGEITATGGARGGDGGSVEVSGGAWLDFAGRVDTHAPFGATGSLLLDPANITISTNATSGGTCPSVGPCFLLLPTSSVANLNVTQLTNALANTNVSVNTSSVPGTGNGDIFVNTPVTYTSTHTLSLTADRNINIANALTNGGTGAINL
ncbi:MAG TPA: filamentous hemagglutinin N-terminal domain-containing protein, partial [Burkholderiales bacterium]|nr:filamentous hemagglutinin N-terminal domain-containing protein [Burkholderiales bacterium]